MFDTLTRHGASGVSTGYEIERSLRFNRSDSAGLTWTPSSAGNRKTWTFSCWLKRSSQHAIHSGYEGIFGTGTFMAGSSWGGIYFDNYEAIALFDNTISQARYTSRKFRDPSAWYHIVVYFSQTDGATKIYVNGEAETVYSTDTVGSNADGNVNNNTEHYIGRDSGGNYFDGYMAEIHFVDGQALAASNFGEYDSDTGAWVPKQYTGSHGTNGFYLNFSDNSNTTSGTLGDDDSANSNDWTPSNFSVSAGVGNDSLTDTPTNNHATLAFLKGYGSTYTNPTNGNLDYSLGDTTAQTFSSTAVGPTGKWYVEITATAAESGRYALLTPEHTAQWDQAYAVIPQSDVRVIKRGSSEIHTSITAISNGDIVGIALDCDNNTAQAYLNGSSLGTAVDLDTVAPDKIYMFGLGRNSSGGGTPSGSVNFGQRAFSHQPTGFEAWNTSNRATPTIKNPGDHFNASIYEGTITDTSTQAISGIGFQPEMTWIKRRDGNNSHQIVDVVQGTGKWIEPSGTAVQQTSNTNGVLTSFDTDGFTLTGGSTNAVLCCEDDAQYVSWSWNGGTNASNSDGSINSTVNANTSAGFSIATYVGNNATGATVGHGLNAVPQLYIIKDLDTSGYSWHVYHASLGATKEMTLNTATSVDTQAFWNDTAPTSSVFTVNGGGWEVNTNTKNHIAYVFSAVDGFSKFGSYTGNGADNGQYVYLGFSPAFIIIKHTTAGENWSYRDHKRDKMNPRKIALFSGVDDEQDHNVNRIDFLSNGFKIRDDDARHNTNGDEYIYIAFAKSPLKYATAE